MKGVVDTLGNTVGTLGEGVVGTVQGVGDGIGSTVQFAGGALGAGAGQIGSVFAGKIQGQGKASSMGMLPYIGTNSTTDETVDCQKQPLQAASKKGDGIESDVSSSVQEHSTDASTAVKQAAHHRASVKD